MYSYNKLRGFTLPELLIILMILGLISALSIPILLTNVNEEEFITKSRRAISLMNQAARMQYALNGNTYATVAEEGAYNRQYVYDNFFKKRFHIISEGTIEIEGIGSFPCVFTSDGIAYAIADDISKVYVDLNGKKGPNRLTRTPTSFKDVIAIIPSRAIIQNTPLAHTALQDFDYNAWGIYYNSF